MTFLILGIILFIVGAVASLVVKTNKTVNDKLFRLIALVPAILGIMVALAGSFAYNDAGYCQHVRTIFGQETSECSTGWYFEGWGYSTSWPHNITVAFSDSVDVEGSSITGPYAIKMADNWTGAAIQTTRFAIPQDKEQFLNMAADFRSPERLITTTLRPAITASLDSVANMFTMEEYYAGGFRDQFKSEFADAVVKGRARVEQIRVDAENDLNSGGQTPSGDVPSSEDSSSFGDTDSTRVITKKTLDSTGNEIRFEHDYIKYGIVVSSAILEKIDPDDRFEVQIQARKDAASRRIVAREERLEQEEQRLLAIQAGATAIAKEQAAAQTAQIRQTTEAETEKKLALIFADKLRQEAEIARQTSIINLEKARVDADAVIVSADAEAHAKKVILEADGALAQKLAAWVEAQKVWADATSRINVPSTVIGGAGEAGNALNTVGTFMDLMVMKAARDLSIDIDIRGGAQ